MRLRFLLLLLLFCIATDGFTSAVAESLPVEPSSSQAPPEVRLGVVEPLAFDVAEGRVVVRVPGEGMRVVEEGELLPALPEARLRQVLPGRLVIDWIGEERFEAWIEPAVGSEQGSRVTLVDRRPPRIPDLQVPSWMIQPPASYDTAPSGTGAAVPDTPEDSSPSSGRGR